MGFISFGGLHFCLGGLKPPKPMPGYVPEATSNNPAQSLLVKVDKYYVVI